jgi:hypothetical protein
MSISDLLKELKLEWVEPREVEYRGEKIPFRLVCKIRAACPLDTINLVKSGTDLPPELIEFWSAADGGEFFADMEYGQWGLRIWDVESAVENTSRIKSERPESFIEGDLIVGEFLGDSDLLFVRCDRSAKDYGGVTVALPIDPRREWTKVGADFGDFLRAYIKAKGDKFWEP